ncbi:hypothetical protein BH20ACT7_BH20ACT7_05760 [soil metagenome]|jgi:hypothetical protein
MTPYGALTRLSRHLESVRAPGEVLPGPVATVASTLRLPCVAVHLVGEDAMPIAA